LKHFKQYLLGRRFKIRTDHAALTWLRKTPEPIGQQARWLEQMEEYDFEIEHRPGAQHQNADALSRRPCQLKGCVGNQVTQVTRSEEERSTPSSAELTDQPRPGLNISAAEFMPSRGDGGVIEQRCPLKKLSQPNPVRPHSWRRTEKLQ